MRKWVFLLPSLGLTNCAPPLAAPDTQVTANAYLAAPTNNPSFTTGEIPPEWWQIYGNASLDTLVETGLQSSPTLAQATANLNAAAATGDAANGVYLPQIGLNPNVTRAAYPTGPNGSPPYTIFSLAGTISYDPGLFGARHYTFENSAAEVAYSQAELDAARQSLIGNIVAAVISEAGYNAQIATTEQIITVEQNLLTLLNGEYLDGAIPKLNVLQQQSQIQATQANLYPLQTHAEEMQDRVAVLTGQLPAAAANPQIDLAAIRIPQQIPVTLPSAYLANRPDLQAARAQVAAQNASLGIAVAHLYPDLTLSAQGGYAYVMDLPWTTLPGLPPIRLHFGADGISLPLLFLTAIVTFAAIAISPHAIRRSSEYYCYLLLMSLGAMGAFISLDIFFFYIFHEFALTLSIAILMSLVVALTVTPIFATSNSPSAIGTSAHTPTGFAPGNSLGISEAQPA